MTAERALRERLLQTSAVADLVGDRMYPDELPQSPTYPAIVYTRISSVDGLTIDGRHGLQRTRIQVDAWARRYVDMETLHEAIKAALHGKSWTASDGSQVQLAQHDTDGDGPKDPSIDPAQQISRRRADYFIYFRKAGNA